MFPGTIRRSAGTHGADDPHQQQAALDEHASPGHRPPARSLGNRPTLSLFPPSAAGCLESRCLSSTSAVVSQPTARGLWRVVLASTLEIILGIRDSTRHDEGEILACVFRVALPLPPHSASFFSCSCERGLSLIGQPPLAICTGASVLVSQYRSLGRGTAACRTAAPQLGLLGLPVTWDGLADTGVLLRSPSPMRAPPTSPSPHSLRDALHNQSQPHSISR